MSRVLFIANTYPYWTGTDEAALVLIRRLAARRHHVTVLETWSDILEPHLAGVDGVTVVRHLSSDMGFGEMRTGWLRTLRAHPSDVCILNKGWYRMQRGWLDLAARASSRRYVALEHHPAELPSEIVVNGDPLTTAARFRTIAALAGHYAALHQVVTNSVAVRERLRTSYRLSRRKGVVVPHGIDLDTFRFDRAGRERMRARLGVADDTFLIGSLGRLAQEKGFDRLLPVFARIVRDPALHKVRLVIAGVGPEQQRLSDGAVQLGIADSVIFPGWVGDADRVPFLSALDAFVVPSRVEGQGLALVQAMACERPSVATNCGGVADVLTRPGVGWLTATDDFNAFERALREVIALPASERAAVGARARTHVEEHFEVNRQADRMIDALLGPFAST